MYGNEYDTGARYFQISIMFHCSCLSLIFVLKSKLKFSAFRYEFLIWEKTRLYISSVELLCYRIICTSMQIVSLFEPASHLIYIPHNSSSVRQHLLTVRVLSSHFHPYKSSSPDLFGRFNSCYRRSPPFSFHSTSVSFLFFSFWSTFFFLNYPSL